MSATSTLAPLSVLPAIDLSAGRCVRLLRGDFSAETVYGDPVEVALGYVAAGASALHVVDLDAARTGEPTNRGVAMAVAARAGVPVQLGGGIRDEESAETALAAGIERVVLGTAGLEDPRLLAALARRHPGRVVLGLDHRRSPAAVRSGREVALRGWQEGSGIDLLDALDAVDGLPLAGVLVTDIGTDGTLSGPDLEGYSLVLAHSHQPLIASGGVGSAGDLVALAALEAAGRRVEGVVVGKALLAGTFTLAEAVAACAR